MAKADDKTEIKTLFKDLKAGDIEATKSIIQKMYEYNLDPDKPGVVIKYINWQEKIDLTDEQRKIIMFPPPKSVSTTSSGPSIAKEWLEANDNKKRDLALALIDDHFRQGYMRTDKTVDDRLFQIKNLDLKIVSALPGTVSGAAKAVRNKLAETIQSLPGSVVEPKILREIHEWWSEYSTSLKGELTDNGFSGGVLACSSAVFDDNPDKYPEYKDAWSLYKSPHKPDKTVKFPLIQKTLDRMSEGDAFAAWLWGVYTNQYKGRQVWWMYGAEGEEGKSYFGSFLGCELFGLNAGYKVANSAQLKGNRPFTNSSYVGAKLVIYPDCNNPKVLENEHMKEMSGGGRDQITHEEKFKAAQTSTIDARFILNSNKLPSVKRDKWYLSRLALCRVTPFKDSKDPHIKEKYSKELPGFLAYAEECYSRLCLNDEEIMMKPETIKFINDLIDQYDPDMRDIFTRHFDVDPLGEVDFKTVISVIQDVEGIKNHQVETQFKEYIRTLPGIEIHRKGSGNSYKGISQKKKSLPGPKNAATELLEKQNSFGRIM